MWYFTLCRFNPIHTCLFNTGSRKSHSFINDWSPDPFYSQHVQKLKETANELTMFECECERKHYKRPLIALWASTKYVFILAHFRSHPLPFPHVLGKWKHRSPQIQSNIHEFYEILWNRCLCTKCVCYFRKPEADSPRPTQKLLECCRIRVESGSY